MKVQRFCLRSFLQHFLLCCVISSLLCCSFSFDSYAASTNVAADQNGDGQITADEVDIAQLVVFGLVSGYGVVGADLSTSILNSGAYTSALSDISADQNTVVIGEVVDGNISFGSWFKNLCANVYAELTNASVIGYKVYPALTYDFVISKFNEHCPSDNPNYTNMYNLFMNNTTEGDIFVWNDTSAYYMLYDNEKSELDLNNKLAIFGTSYLKYLYLSGSSYSSSSLLGYYFGKNNSGTNAYFSSRSSEIYLNANTCLGVLGSPLVVFNDQASAIKFIDGLSDIYLSSKSFVDFNSDFLKVSLINANDWNGVCSNIYNQVSSAVKDSNALNVHQIQSIIDEKFDNLYEEVSPGEEDSEDPGTDIPGNSELADKLEQNNQLQQESNQLQEENNQLQQESNQLQEENNQLQEESNALQEEENETSKGILGKITEFFGSFFQNLIDSVVGIFVPDQEDMQANFERLDQFFSDTFGFLYYPFDFLIEVINIFLTADSSTGLVFPGFSIMGYEVWGDISFDLTSIEIVNTVFETVRLITGGVLAFMFIQYLRNFFDKRFGGGGA